MLHRIALLLLVAVATTAAAPVKVRDWFVRAGSTGDGSREKPFGDPWEALEKCEAGDAIHVAAGRYFGKMGDAQWKIPFDKVQLIGGYNAEFTERDPWKHHTQLLWSKESKNWPLEGRVQSAARDVVIDGIVFDMREQNGYDAAQTGRTELPTGKPAIYLWLPSTVRHCVFVNTGTEAIVCRNGTTIENNLFLNTMDSAVKIQGLPPANPDSKIPAVVKNNTFVWSWCDRAPGSGRYSGAGIHMTGHATISNNIFAHCDNNAIYCTINPEKSSITNNVFSMNLWSALKMFIDGGDRVVDDKTMDLLEEVGLKAFEGNTVANPELPLDPEWMDATLKRTAAQPGKVVMDDWNKLRQALGLNLKGEGGKAASGVAPPYPLEKAFALMAPKNAAIKAGARVVKLEAKFTGAVAGAPEKTYEKVDVAAFKAEPKKYDGKAIELLVGINGVANVSGLPSAYKKDDHEGVKAYDAAGAAYVIAFFRKGTNAQRVMSDVGGWFSSGKPERLYAIQGTAHASEGFDKAWIFVETAAKHERAATARTRARGRDWFVRAGASGGDGSREKPFRDPFQPLERCEAGDAIHVAGGEYVGKLRAGVWKVDTTDIALLGGYDAEFKERDPWKNLTVLHCPADYKGRRGGYTLEGDGDHSGMVVDGFVFDKRLNNKYAANGDLMVMESDKSEHLWVARPDCVVRNCIFLNGAMGALRASAGQLIENNIFMNHNGQTIELQAGHTTAPTVVRNNTILFSWDRKFGSSETRQGTHLILGTRVNVVVDGNIFQFADNHAVRLNVDEKDADLVNNVFSHNLWSIIDRPRDFRVVDEKTFAQLKDFGWRKCEGNQVLVPNIPIDEKWFSVYLNRTAYVPGKVVMDDWNKLREMLGQPVLATGGKPAEGYAPVYDRALAATLFPKNEACKAGARPVKLDVKFEGIERKEESHEYVEVKWDEAARNRDAWEKLDGKRVWMKVAIKSTDNQYQLGDVKEGEYQAFQVGGEQGSDSGLPMRCYVKRGTRHERMMKQSKGYATGKPEEYHVLKGIARANRQMVVEAIEKAE